MSREVKLEETTTYDNLMQAIETAAKDQGLKVEARDLFKTSYRLGSVHETRKYRETDVEIKGSFLKAFGITIWKSANYDQGDHRIDSFHISKGPMLGCATKREVERFLSCLSGHLQRAEATATA